MIGVVDYRAGNAPSVVYALERLDVPTRLAGADDLENCDRLILPGVGAARATLDSLRESDLVEPLTTAIGKGIPFLGICIGLQVLFDHSEEDDTPCLGWLSGRVRRFPDSVRVPQMGWNEVRFTGGHPLVEGLGESGHFYFVNSYFAKPDDASITLGITDYAGEFCSVAAHDNIAATQFHAEKSGELGLTILGNFARWDGAPC
jgi:imidazole glycerol-phosphate synthase subunit HisH